MIVFKTFTFSAAHRLPHVASGHKCSRVHGHNYQVRLECQGRIGQASGWVCDFRDIARAWDVAKAGLDHRTLNDIEGLENPTCEHLARWIWDRVSPLLPEMHAIEILETPGAGVRYQPR